MWFAESGNILKSSIMEVQMYSPQRNTPQEIRSYGGIMMAP